MELVVKGHTFITCILADGTCRLICPEACEIVEIGREGLETWYRNSPNKFFGYHIGLWLAFCD